MEKEAARPSFLDAKTPSQERLRVVPGARAGLLFRRWRASARSRSVARPVNQNLNADVPRILRTLRRRLLAGVLLEQLAGSALIVAAALVVLGAMNRWVFAAGPADAWILLAAALATFALALLGTLASWPSLRRVAAIIDQRGQTRDRLVSALAFAERRGTEPMQQLAEQECAAFIARAKFAPLIPIRPPVAAQWLIVPIAALVFLRWDYEIAGELRRAAAAAAQAEVAGAVNQLEQLAQRATKASEESISADLRQLAEQLKESAERLRGETNAAAAQKAALREISALEQAMKELQRQPSTTDEMKALAQALASAPGMKDVLDALDRDSLEAAAKALEDAEKKNSQESPPATEQQVREALEKALERLAQQRQLSAALQKLAQQMRAQAGNITSSAMQQLREMIQQMQERDGATANGNTASQQMTLQQLIAALENMKFDDGQSHASRNSEGFARGAGPQISIQAFGPTDAGDPRSADNGRQPSGGPGSERDFGTTDSPFGGKSDRADKGAELVLKGQLADGESLSTMLSTAGDRSKSARRYKELYEALAPAAEDAVQQENIPLGSRFLIKRYFESIRPAE